MSSMRVQLDWLVERLGSIFAILGTLAVVAAIFTYLILGRLDRPVIVLAAIGLGLWVYAALEQPERTVQTLSSRNVRYGSNTLVMSLAFLGILALVNVLANRFDQRLDLTQNHLYTLAPLSVQVVQELKQPVQIYAFYQTGQTGRDDLEDLLKEYVRYSNGKITYQFVDPVQMPGLARQYNVQNYGTTVLVSSGKQQSVTGGDEGSLTSALLKLTRDKSDIVYYLTGHGELDFASAQQDGASGMKSALEADNYTVKSLNLAASGKVPTDAAAVIVAGPTTPLLPQEVSALEEYMDNGGKALFLVDKRQHDALEPIAERYGVQIGNGVVVDPGQSLNYDPLTPVINRYQVSPITNSLPMLVFQGATTVTPVKSPPAGLQVQPLAQTTEQSWLETDTKVVHYDPGVDPQGPLTVAVSVTKQPAQGSVSKNPASGMRAVFIGDVVVATNSASQLAGDKQIVTNSVNWLTANEDLIQIEAKTPLDQSLVLSNTQLNLLLYGSAVILPLAVLALGGIVWWNRR